MRSVRISTLYIAAIAAFCLLWTVDPVYLHFAGLEGVLRWGALGLIAVLALTTNNILAFLASRTAWAQILFFAVCAVTVALAGGGDGYVEILRTAPIVLICPLVIHLCAIGERRRLQTMLVALFAAISIASIAAGYGDGRFIQGRLFGIAWHPNALTLGAATLSTIALFEARWSGPARLLLFALGAVTVYLTDSLVGQLIVVFALLVRVLQLGAGQRITALLLVVGPLLVLVLPPLLSLYLGADYRGLANRLDAAIFIRLSLWYDALRLFAQQPIFGTGYADGQAVYDVGVVTSVDYSHSLVINYLRTTGIVGLGAIALLLAQVARLMLREKRGDMFAISLFFPVLFFSSVEAGLQQMPLSWALLWVGAGFALRAEPAVEKQLGLLPALPVPR